MTRLAAAFLGVVAIAATGLVVGCHFDSPIFTPSDDDSAYPCRDKDGHRTANEFSCRSYDGIPGCCYNGQQCEPDGCAAEPLPYQRMGAKRHTKRLPESGR